MIDASEAKNRSNRPVVVIIGGGFGGLAAARSLKDAFVRVILIDRSNHHLFQPLLYQVATSGLAATDIAKPIRSILCDQDNVEVFLDEVMKIDMANRLVITADLTFCYDYLVLACGARHSYFGKDEWEQYAPGLKTMRDAIDIRHRILVAFEVAEKASDPEERKQAMTFVVVGGGPTGVEMAGAISELARFTLKKDFRRINPTDTCVLLVEAAPRVLPMFDPTLSAKALEHLKELHVDVRLGTRVTNVTEDYVELDGVPVPTRTVIWAAGNIASPLGKQLGAEVDGQGRVIVDPDLSIPGHPEIFVVGDMALAKRSNGMPVPGVSPAAMQGGRHAGQNILHLLKGEPTQPFEYLDKGSMATIGRHAAVADLHVLKFGGFFAWLTWAFVHLYFLIDFKNRIRVFLNWAFSYFTYSQGSRLIQVQPKEGALLHNPPTGPIPPPR